MSASRIFSAGETRAEKGPDLLPKATICLVLPLLVPILYAVTNKYLFSIGFTGRFGFFNYTLKKMSTACEGESIYACKTYTCFSFGSILSVNIFFILFIRNVW